MIASRLGLLGVSVDREANEARGTEAVISPRGAPVPVLVIPTNEELLIALQTRDAVARARQAGGAPTAS
jgi:acetate kinase